MKLWVIALAISAAAGCGHSDDAEEQSSSKNTNQVTEAPVTVPPPTINTQPANAVTDTGGVVESQAPNMPANAPKPKPEKPRPRPKQEAVDFTK